jgi:hypothetical protein
MQKRSSVDQKHMLNLYKRVPEIRALLRDVDPDATGQGATDGWTLGCEMYGITTYYKQAADGTISVRMSGTLTDLPLFEQCAVLHEVDLFKTWMPFCTHSTLLAKLGYAEVVPYICTRLPPCMFVSDVNVGMWTATGECVWCSHVACNHGEMVTHAS